MARFEEPTRDCCFGCEQTRIQFEPSVPAVGIVILASNGSCFDLRREGNQPYLCISLALALSERGLQPRPVNEKGGVEGEGEYFYRNH